MVATFLSSTASLLGCDPDQPIAEIDELEHDDAAAPVDELTGPELPKPEPEPTPTPAPAAEGLDLAVSQPGLPRSLTVTDPHTRVVGGDSSCSTDTICVDSIPMTGTVSPLFETVDHSMRQFMQIRCVGGGVLAVSRNGRRVYKRGFGRMKGAASVYSHCEDNDYDAMASPVRPDSPFPVASVSKFVVASAVRELVSEAESTSNPTAVKAVDVMPDLLLEYFVHTGSTGTCAPVPGWNTGTYVPGDDPQSCGLGRYPDPRFDDITIGDLIGHSSGLGSGFANSVGWHEDLGATKLANNFAALRSNDQASDWNSEIFVLYSTTNYQSELLAARTAIAASLGGSVTASDIIFINYYNALDGWTPVDDYIITYAGNQLSANPSGADDADPEGRATGYSNDAYRLLGRIAAHLHYDLHGGEELWAAPDGFPELHDDTALAWFLAENGIERGVWSEEAIFNRQFGDAPGYEDPTPYARNWDNDVANPVGTYEYDEPSKLRPWCLLDGDDCDFSYWLDDDGAADDFAPNWDFTTTGMSGSPLVPHYRDEPNSALAETGGLAMEMPALVMLLDRYYASGGNIDDSTRFGTPLDSCGYCTETVGKNGWYSGVFAEAWQLRGETSSFATDPQIDSTTKKITYDLDPWSTSSVTWTEPEDVNFGVALNQHDNEDGFGPFWELEEFISYGLRDDPDDGVDWDAVDRMIHHQGRHVVGMSLDGSSNTLYWYEGDGNVSDVVEYVKAFWGTPGDHFGSTSPFDIDPYALPATRIGTDVLGVAIKDETVDVTYAWYADGHYSSGTSYDLGSISESGQYTLASGWVDGIYRPLEYDELIDVAFANNGYAYNWYTNGTRAAGTPSDLDYHLTGTYTIPDDQTYGEIEAISIDWADDNSIWVRYRNGAVSNGTSYVVDSHDYWPASPIAMSVAGNITTLFYANGWYRKYDGMPTATYDINNLVAAGYWHSGDGSNPAAYRLTSELLGFAEEDSSSDGVIYYWDGKKADVDGVVPGAATTVTYPGGYGPGDVVGFAMDNSGYIYTYFDSGVRAKGTPGDLASHSTASYSVVPGMSYGDIIATAMTDGGDLWTLYTGGVLTWGTDTDLDAHGTYSP